MKRHVMEDVPVAPMSAVKGLSFYCHKGPPKLHQTAFIYWIQEWESEIEMIPVFTQ